MKNRYRLVRYGRCRDYYYLHDKETGQREGLETKDKARANEPAFNLQKARIYLAASDAAVATRTGRGHREQAKGSQNRHRWETFSKDQAIGPLLAG